MGKTYLLTGPPRVGKTRIIKQIVAHVGITHCGGFYTEEIQNERKADPRMGFRIRTLEGKTGTLAHLDIDTSLRLGRYGIDLTCLEAIGIPALLSAAEAKQLIIIDELGPIQAFSEPFKRISMQLLQSPRLILGTIALQPHPWLDAIKQREEVTMYIVQTDNTVQLTQTILEVLTSVL
jgi:nucleoside-triphosphatase